MDPYKSGMSQVMSMKLQPMKYAGNIKEPETIIMHGSKCAKDVKCAIET